MDETWGMSDEGDEDLIATCEMEDLGKQMDKVSFGTLSWNARSWNEMKKDGLMRMLKDSKAEVDVMCIQEVWGSNNVTEIEGYHAPISRTRDAKGKVNANCGGGVATYVKKGMKAYEQYSPRDSFTKGVYESVWTAVTTKEGVRKIIGNIYRPPGGTIEKLEQMAEIHENTMRKVRQKYKNYEMLVMGDFNLDIESMAGERGKGEEGNRGLYKKHTRRLVNSMERAGLHQTVAAATRETCNVESLIDHMYVDTETLEKNEKTLTLVVPTHLSDHHSVCYLEQRKGGKNGTTRRTVRVQTTKR
jgi:exonuclease III